MTDNSPVVIIGAGYAGLTAAQRLHRENIPFVIYEASPRVAGLASTFDDVDGFSYDFGTHLITNRLAATLGIKEQCRNVEYFGESVFINGKDYRYPFGLASVPRYALGAARSRLQGGSQPAVTTAAEWAEATMGRELAREIAIPLMESLMGAPASELSPAVGNKLPGTIHTLALRAAGKLTRRAVAIGYCQDLPESPRVWHVYPETGIACICNHLMETGADNISLNTPVQRVIVENERVTHVEINGLRQPAAAVISTAPVNVLPRLLEGTDKLDHLTQFSYSSMVFVNLFLKGHHLMPNVAVWFPETRFDFFRVQEPPISLPWTAPARHTYLTVDIGCKPGSELWALTDEELTVRCLNQLSEVIPNIHNRFLTARVLRTKTAYPIYFSRYEHERCQFKENSGIEGLYSVGRNGEFAHILMEDVYHRTQKKVNDLLNYLAHL